MSKSESFQILSEFQKNEFLKPQKRKSNNRFRGHVFSSIGMNHIAKHISLEEFTPVLGPVWIKDLEWIEWDGAIIKNSSKEILPHYYKPSDIAAIFEFKINGIYGTKYPQKGKKTVQQVVKSINDNFEAAKRLNKNLGCFYISLYERRPDSKRKRSQGTPIDYYAETKKLPITTCILFNSRFRAKSEQVQLDSWANVITELESLKV